MAVPTVVTQYMSDIDRISSARTQRQRLKDSAYREWQNRLGRKDRLPRGRYFVGKTAGPLLAIYDEYGQYSASLPSRNLSPVRHV